jgi:tRNA pseudouridine55 synthase
MATSATDGILLVDKPAGPTSHDVVAMVRRARAGIRAGHTGTLDPFATGLLVLALGRATRLIRFLPSEPKIYRATIRFGTATDTDDATGEVAGQGPLPPEGTIREGIRQLTGTLEQVPPAFSARHVAGRRAYAVAREGGSPDLKASTVNVQHWDVEEFTDGALTASITCGAGTYIRALARDLGRLCGTVAHLAMLRRVRIGPFDVSEAVHPHAASDAPLRSPADALSSMPHQIVQKEEQDLVNHGRPVVARESGNTAALVDDAGDLLAVAERDGDWWQPRVVMTGG